MTRRALSGIAAAALTAGLFLWAPPAFAQPKPSYAPSSTHIFPAGGRRGTTLNVRVGAECIPPGTHFHLTGAGVTAPNVLGEEVHRPGEPSPRREPTEIPITHPREWASEIVIAEGARLGPAYWRLSCAQGGTGSRPFIVGDLPEFVETESNSVPAKADAIKLPVTVNGQIHGERDADYFRFAAEAGEVVVCDVLAGRIGSRLDPVVELLDADGRRLPAQEIRQGSDPVLALKVETPGDYLLRIANVTVHGDPAHVYRVNISTAPFVHFAFPAGGQAGSEREVDFYLLTGTGAHRVVRRRVKFSEQPASEWAYRLGPGLDVADESATSRQETEVRSQESEQERITRRSNAVSFAVDHLSNLLEQEPNDTAGEANEIAPAVTVDGRTLTAGDEDWFRFAAVKGEVYSIRCRAYPAGTAALPTLTLFAADASDSGDIPKSPESSLATSRAVDSADGSCNIEWTAPADGTYLLRVRDMQFGARGGPDFVYRLSIRTSEPDYSLKIASAALNVTQGKQAKLPITLRRFGGLNGPVKLSFKGLPEGVTVDATEIPAGKNEIEATVTAADDAASQSVTLKVTGRAQVGEMVIERTARARHLGVDAEGVSAGSPTLEDLPLCVQHKPLFRLFCSEAYLYAYRGSIFPYPMEVERLDGFDGEIHLQQGDRQNRDMDGVNILDATIPPGQTAAIVPIYLPETMHINVQSQSQLYTQAYATFTDAAGRPQSVLVLAEKRNMLRTLPPVVKLKALDEELRARPGQTVPCRLHLERTTNFPGPMTLRLRDTGTADGFRVVGRFDVVGRSPDRHVVGRSPDRPTSPTAGLPQSKVEETYGQRQVRGRETRVQPDGAFQTSAGETDVTLPLRVSTDVPPGTRQSLTFRATGELGKHTIVTEATVTIEVQPAE